MSPSPDPPFEQQPPGISLEELTRAFAEVMGVEPQRSDRSAPTTTDERSHAASAPDAMEPVADAPSIAGAEEDACPISPQSILEAMLFVGNRDNRPLPPAQAAEVMRDVEPDEIPPLVDELNRRYAAREAPYRVVGEGSGYRLTLDQEFHKLRNGFYGRVREARLSQAAIDVLALVAYQQPLTGDKISRLRGKPSGHVLAHLVRRGLLRIERPDPKRRTPHYYTTDRFLGLFALESLADLPRSEDPGPP